MIKKEKLKTRSTKVKKPLVEYKTVTDDNLWRWLPRFLLRLPPNMKKIR